MNCIYIVFLVVTYQIGATAHNSNSLRHGNVRNDDTTKLLMPFDRHLFDNDINSSKSFEGAASGRKIEEEKEDRICAKQNSCQECTRTVISNNKNCMWFFNMTTPVCSAVAKSGMGEGHDMCTMSKQETDKQTCAAKTSTGCAGCLNTAKRNGKKCKWFGSMKNPVCSHKKKKKIGKPSKSCPFVPVPAPVNEEDKKKCASKTLKGCGKCTNTRLSNREKCKWFSTNVCAALAEDRLGEVHDMCAF